MATRFGKTGWVGAAAIAAALLPSLMASRAEAQVIVSASMSAITTFGSNGWLAPSVSVPYLTTDNTQRGMAYNPLTNEVLVAFRNSVSGTSNSIVRFDGTTGATLGVMSNSGVTGGDFAINAVDVAADGVIYAANTASGTNPFKVYSWETASATPTTVFTNTINSGSLSGITHLGQSFAVFGSGAATQFASGGSTTTNRNNFTVGQGLVSGSFTSATSYINVTPTSASGNDYRLGLTFVDADTLIGLQGGPARFTDFNGTTASIVASTSSTLGGTVNFRVLDYIKVGDTPFIAALRMDTSAVNIYDITTPTSPILRATRNNTVSPASNGNGTGAISWGDITTNIDGTYTAELYAMSTNQGVQAFQVTFVPEPSTWAMLVIGGGVSGFAALRRRLRRQG